MFQRLIENARLATGAAVRHTFFIAATAVSLFVTTGFLSAAAFVVVLRRYGPVEACLTGAGIFFVVTLLCAGSYFVLRRTRARRVASGEKSTAQSFAPDPAMLIAGLQVARAVGLKRLVPVIAIGALVLGALAAKNLTGSEDDSDTEPE